jgi:F0F1-type ATP synthase delta subunit
MENAYAQALWKMIEGGMKHQDAVRSLRDKLASGGRENLLPRIAHAFARIAERENNKSKIRVYVAHQRDAHHAMTEAKKALARIGIDDAEMETHIDETLIGGWRLEGKERLLDESYKKHLLSIYNRATH